MDKGMVNKGIQMAGMVVQEAEHVAEAQEAVSMDDVGRMTQDALKGVSDIGRWGNAWRERQWEREF